MCAPVLSSAKGEIDAQQHGDRATELVFSSGEKGYSRRARITWRKCSRHDCGHRGVWWSAQAGSHRLRQVHIHGVQPHNRGTGSSKVADPKGTP